ncbi:hypothetical protein ACQPYK_20810 [Streptosporangium sp. CA-135522]|uniref:hypothetical protein n=1 Tax=Streptosporangium sp. CA-135522 TaxID=3240072 RepID=UPI003D906137
MTANSPPGPPDAAPDPAEMARPDRVPDDPDAPHGRCAHPGCAARWHTQDGRPRPLQRAGTGRPPKFCSSDCKDADRRARQAGRAGPGDTIDGAAWVRQLGEHAAARAALVEQVLTAFAVDRELLTQVRDDLLRRHAGLETATEQAVQAAETADRRAANAELDRDIARQQAAEQQQRTAERRADDALAEAAAARRQAAEDVRRAERRADQAEGQARGAEAVRERAEAALTELRDLAQAEREQAARAAAAQQARITELEHTVTAKDTEVHAGREQAAELRRRLEEQAGQLQRLQSDLDQARAETRTVRDQLGGELAQARHQAETEITELRTQLTEVHAQAAQATTAAKQVSRAETKLELARDELATLRRERDEAIAEREQQRARAEQAAEERTSQTRRAE